MQNDSDALPNPSRRIACPLLPAPLRRRHRVQGRLIARFVTTIVSVQASNQEPLRSASWDGRDEAVEAILCSPTCMRRSVRLDFPSRSILLLFKIELWSRRAFRYGQKRSVWPGHVLEVGVCFCSASYLAHADNDMATQNGRNISREKKSLVCSGT